MKNYYLDRLGWIFKYTSKNFGYVLLKTLCLLVGVPLYAVLFVVEMVVTFVYAIFSIIPVINVVVFIVSRAILFVCDLGFYVNILPDLKQYKTLHPKVDQDAQEKFETPVAQDEQQNDDE